MWLLLLNIALLSTIGLTQEVPAQSNEVPSESAESSSNNLEFPTFSSFAKTSLAESTFELNLPKPILEPERFSVNDEARNFPKEAVDRGLASQEPSRKRRQTDETQIDATIDEAEKIPDQIADEANLSEDNLAKTENDAKIENVEKAENFGARNFPKEAIERGIAQSKRKKRDSSQDEVNVPKVSNFPDFYQLSESDETISEPNFPNTQDRISPLDVAFNDPSLRNYPPPAVPSSAVQPLVGEIIKRQINKRQIDKRQISKRQIVKRQLVKRQAGQDFPNFFQQSQANNDFSSPQFPDTMTRISSGGFQFPDPEQRSFPSPDSVLQGVQRRKRQNGGDILSNRQLVGQDFPNFFQLSQSDQISTPQFPNTQDQIGSGGFGNSGPRGFPTFQEIQQQRQKRGHRNGPGNAAAGLTDVAYFDFLDSFSAPQDNRFFRPSRNAQHQNQGGPRYPPFDPFGNTQFIPLPPSNPHFALPVTSEDPHMNSRFKERFRRPLRNANFRAFFDYSDDDKEEDNFIYESSPEFNDLNIISQLRKLHFH